MSELNKKFLSLTLSEKIFKDIKYFISGEVHEKIEELLKTGGAEKINYFSDYVSHLIVGKFPEETDICDANDLYEIPALTPKWVLICASLNKLVNTKPYLYSTTKIFFNVNFTFSNIEDRLALWSVISYHGDTSGAKYLKAESLGCEQIRIVTPDWVMTAVKNNSLPDPTLFHPKLINWPKPPKPHESTTAITGFEPDSMEVPSGTTEKKNVSDSTQALLEKLKQRMPWNQMATSSDPVAPPNVVAPSFLNKIQQQSPQQPKVSQALIQNTPQSPVSSSFPTIPQSPTQSQQIPRSVVHHTQTSQSPQNAFPTQQTALNINRLIGQSQTQPRPGLQQLRGQLTQNQLHQQLLQQRLHQNQQGLGQRQAGPLTTVQQQLLQQQQRQLLQNQLNNQQNQLNNQQQGQNQLISQQQGQNQLINQQQGQNQLMNQQQSQNQLIGQQQGQNQLMNQQQGQNQLINQQQGQNQLINQQQGQNQLINQQQQQIQDQLITSQGQIMAQNQHVLSQQAQSQMNNNQQGQNQLVSQQMGQNQLLNQQGNQNQLIAQQSAQNQVITSQSGQNQLINQQPGQNQLINQQAGQNQLGQNQIINQQGNQNQMINQQSGQNQIISQQQVQNQQTGQNIVINQQSPVQNQLLNQQSGQNQMITQQNLQNQMVSQQSSQNQLLQSPGQNQLLNQQVSQSNIINQQGSNQLLSQNQLNNQHNQLINQQGQLINQQNQNQLLNQQGQNQLINQQSQNQLINQQQALNQLLNQGQNQLVSQQQQQQLLNQNQQILNMNQPQQMQISQQNQQILQNRVIQQQSMNQQGQQMQNQNFGQGQQHILQQKLMFNQQQVVTSQQQIQNQPNLAVQQQFGTQTFIQNQQDNIQQKISKPQISQQNQITQSTLSQLNVQALNQQLSTQNLGPQLNQQQLNQQQLNQNNQLTSISQQIGLDQGLVQSQLTQNLNQQPSMQQLNQGLGQQLGQSLQQQQTIGQQQIGQPQIGQQIGQQQIGQPQISQQQINQQQLGQQLNPGVNQQVVRAQFQQGGVNQQLLLNQQGQGQPRQHLWSPQQPQGQIHGQQIIRHPVNVIQQTGQRIQWSPNQQQQQGNVVHQRQFIQLDAHTHNQLQKMPPEQQAAFVAKLQKQRQLQLAKQVQQRAGGHILIRGNVPPGLTAQQQVQWLQQQAKQQGIVLPPNIQQNITPGTLTPQPVPAQGTIQHAPGLSPINQNTPQFSDQSQQQQLQLRQYRLQQLQIQREQAQKNHLAQQGAVPQQGLVRPIGQPQTADSTTNPPQIPDGNLQHSLVVNAKTKTALANMLSSKLQSGGAICPPRQETLPEPSAAGTLRLMTAQHNAALNSKPQEIIALQQRRVISGNGEIIKPPGPQLPLTGQSDPPKLQYCQKPPLPVQHRVGPFYGHNPNLKLPPDLFLLGCIFVVVEVEDVLEERFSGWQQKIEKYGGEVEKQYCSKVTHVLCETQRHGVVMQALRDCKRCVTILWLVDVMQRKQVLPPWTALHLPQIYLDITPAAKHLISISGFEGVERARIKEMIKYTGAKFTTYFSKHNTLLISAKSEGKKFIRAKKWGIPVVNVQWLTDVILGNFTALNQMDNQIYQTYSNPPNMSFDPKLVPNMMHAWKAPINISQESYERVKRSASPVVLPKAKKPKTEHIDENDNISEDPPNANYKILFSQFNEEQLKPLEKMARELGGAVSKDQKDFTHLVMPKLIRSTKLLFAISKGLHIVPEKWLRDSHKSKQFLPETAFNLDAEEFNRKYQVHLEKTLQCFNRDRLFEGKYFWITPSVFPNKKTVAELIQSCGGVVERVRRSGSQIEATNSNAPFTYFIITVKQDLHLVADLLKHKKDRQKVVCNVEFVFSAILKQNIEVDACAVCVM